jgi:methylamine---glutamate N-methyltransferase subunit C
VIISRLRMPEEFAKAIALGANADAISNSAMQGVGCMAARIYNSTYFPSASRGTNSRKQILREVSI